MNGIYPLRGKQELPILLPVLVRRETLAVNTARVRFRNLPLWGVDMEIHFAVRTSSAAELDTPLIMFNGDTTLTHYHELENWRSGVGFNSYFGISSPTLGRGVGNTAGAGVFLNGTMFIPSYSENGLNRNIPFITTWYRSTPDNVGHIIMLSTLTTAALAKPITEVEFRADGQPTDTLVKGCEFAIYVWARGTGIVTGGLGKARA